jgi:preprotein translocase subunit SecA
MSTALSVVSDNDRPVAKTATVAERVRRLQAEARQLAQDHVLALTAAMTEATRLAAEIADGGEAYPAGIRDLARRFAEDCDSRVQSIEVINARA